LHRIERHLSLSLTHKFDLISGTQTGLSAQKLQKLWYEGDRGPTLLTNLPPSWQAWSQLRKLVVLHAQLSYPKLNKIRHLLHSDSYGWSVSYFAMLSLHTRKDLYSMMSPRTQLKRRDIGKNMHKVGIKGCQLRAVTHNTSYSRVCLIFPWLYQWNCLLLKELNQKGNNFAKGVENETTGDSEFNDSPVCMGNQMVKLGNNFISILSKF